MVLVASTLAASDPTRWLRDDEVTRVGGGHEALNRVVNGLWRARPRARATGSRCSPRTASRRCSPTSAACSPEPRRCRSTSTSTPMRWPTSSRTPGRRCCSSDPRRRRPGSRRRSGRCAGRDRLAARAASPAARSWEEWLAAASPPSRPPDVEPRPNLMYTSGTTGRPKGVDLPPTMFAGGGTMTEHVAALSQRSLPQSAPTSSSVRCTTPVRCRACACWPQGSRWSCSAGSTPRTCCGRSRPTRRDDGDGAHALRAVAGGPRGRAGEVRRQLA